MPPAARPTEPQRVVPDATCLACGCLCDDVTVSIADERIVDVQTPCDLGRRWFQQTPEADRPVATIDGEPTTLEAALAAAKEILAGARRPLLLGLHDTTCQTQQAATALADRCSAVLDWSGSAAARGAEVALQTVGQSTCSWGEVARRADVVVFWGCDPITTHPRHSQRYSLDAASPLLPGGRADRHCVVVDTPGNATAKIADSFLPLEPEQAFEALWTLRGLLADEPLDEDQVLRQTGHARSVWQQLAERLRGARYAAFVVGPNLAPSQVPHATSQALFSLVREVHAHARCVAVDIGRPGNLAGAKNVLAWRTGYALGIDFSRGYPRSTPGETTADALLTRGEVDAVLLIGGSAEQAISAEAQAALQRLPTIALSPATEPRVVGSAASTQVAIYTATAGLHTAGSVYRSDGVPLPLRKLVDVPYPDPAEVLAQLGPPTDDVLP